MPQLIRALYDPLLAAGGIGTVGSNGGGRDARVHRAADAVVTGTLLVDPDPQQLYRRVTFGLDDGHEVAFFDPRRFGTGELALGPEARDAFFAARLGLEPLGGELTGAALQRLARGRRAPVKAFLLDQRRRGRVEHLRR